MDLHVLVTRARSVIAVTTLLALAWPAAAQWSGKGEAGLAIADGNTSTRTANAKLALAWKVTDWEHDFGFETLYVRNDGTTTARRWDASAQSRYSFGGGDTFWFGGGRYEQDRFSGFDHQGVVNTGIGHKFFDSDATKLSAQVGVGYKFWRTRTVPADSDRSVAGTAQVDFTHQFTATTSLTNTFGAEIASDNNFLQDQLALAVKMSGRLALSLAYAVRHNTDPPAGFRKTDRLSTVNLVYEVK